MYTPLFIAGLALLIAGFIASWILDERAMKLLSKEEKEAFLNACSWFRASSALPLAFLFFALFGIGSLPQDLSWPTYFVCWVVLAIYFVLSHLMVQRRLRKLGIKPDFQKADAGSRWAMYFGFLAFCVLHTLNSFSR